MKCTDCWSAEATCGAYCYRCHFKGGVYHDPPGDCPACQLHSILADFDAAMAESDAEALIANMEQIRARLAEWVALRGCA